MAIIGGAGNPVGGSFTGPAEALEIVGDHGLALSGLFSSNTSTYTMLNFTRVIIIWLERLLVQVQ